MRWAGITLTGVSLAAVLAYYALDRWLQAYELVSRGTVSSGAGLPSLPGYAAYACLVIGLWLVLRPERKNQ